jgi:tryptophanyl-tRNA synthetase
VEELHAKLRAGGYGWGHAKKDLLDVLLDRFSVEREKFAFYMENRDELDAELKKGADKARIVAQEVLGRVREKAGYAVRK